MLLSVGGSRAVLAGIALLGTLLMSGPFSHAQAALSEPEARFCQPHELRDYTAPFKRMPKLRQPSENGQIGFGPKNLRLRPAPALVFGGGEVGFALDLARRKGVSLPWSAEVSLVEVNGSGRPIGTPRRSIKRVGQVKPSEGESFTFTVPEEPAFYRATIAFYGASDRKLGKFSSYYRVMRSNQEARLRLSASAYRPGTAVVARVENFGVVPMSYGLEYNIERLEGGTWVRAPESPTGPIDAIALISSPGMSGACLFFRVPASTPVGRYRMVKDVHLPSWAAARERTERTLTAEFDLVP